MTERRRVRLLIPDADGEGARLAVGANGHVPVIDLEFEVELGRTTASAFDDALRSFAAGATIVEYAIDQTTADGFDGHIEVIAHVDLAPSDVVGGAMGWHWASTQQAVIGTVPSLQPFVDAWLAEWAGGPVPPRRAPWSQRGWFRTFRTWIDEQLLAHDGAPALDVAPFRMWGISAVFRVDSPVGVRWAKAVFPGFAAEPAITAALHRLAPGAIAPVLAIDADRGWLLLEHAPGVPVATQIDRTDGAIGALVRLQGSVASHGAELLATGVADRSIDRLADDVTRSLAAAATIGIAGTVDQRVVRDAVRAAVSEVAALGVPDTVVHGDFHPSNVMVDGERFIIFDWSDAAWSHPLVDVGAWAAWYRDEPATIDRLWATWGAAWGLSAEVLQGARPALDVVVAAYHVVSYVGIAQGLEPVRVDEAVGAVGRFLQDLERAVERV